MDIDQHPNLHNDPPSECRSFGSNYRACSQPRKISRGILIDSSAKFGPKNANEEAFIQSEECLTPSKANPVEDGNRLEPVDATDTGKHPVSLVQETSPSLSTRSFHRKIPTSEAIHGPTESNCNESSKRRYDSMIVGRKDSNAEGIEKLSSATAQEVVPEDKTKKVETRGCETLRMKLWEILGTVSSPNKQHLNDYDLKVGAKDLESPQKNNGEHNPAVKSKQNSDTIESDSEIPNETVSRLMTRSLGRKRASNKLKANRTRNGRSTCYKDIEGKNTPCFREEFSARISYGIHGGSLKKNKSKKPGSATEACKTCSLDQGNQGENQRVRNQREVIPPGERSLSHGNGVGDDKEFHCRRKAEFIAPKSVALHRDSNQSPLAKMSDNLRNVIGSPKLQENAEWQEDVCYSFFKSTTNEKVEAKSPTFEMRTPTKRSSPGFPPTEIKIPTENFSDDSPLKRQPRGRDDCSPTGMVFDTKGIQCFKSWLASKSNYYWSNSLINSSDDAGEHEDTPIVNPRPTVEEEPENRMSKSSSQDSDSETSGEDSHIKGCREPELCIPKIGNVGKSTYVLHLNKKQRYLDGTKITGFCPSFTSPKGVEERSRFQQHLELKQEDGLTREVALFALALKRFKRKMNSVARKRSAEILMSVAERINSQLQNAECQIQADAGKLTNHSKSKRKRLEMRYQVNLDTEIEGELKAMHERFKEEVSQHLQHCRNTVEGLEAHQMELKVAAEKLRASNRKLLLQAEAAIETEISDAQRRITMIQNSARGKMLQLKNIVAGCLKEGIFN